MLRTKINLICILTVGICTGWTASVRAADLVCDNGTEATVSFAGAVQDFTIPPMSLPGVITLRCKGGNGGTATTLFPIGGGSCSTAGGKGVEVQGTFAVGFGSDELRPGQILRFIIGQAGQSASASILDGYEISGGGGGSGILYEHPTNGWIPLLVAGGGGGSYRPADGAICANGKPGDNGQTGECGSNGNGPFGGSGGCGGLGGGAGPGRATGGGGLNQDGQGISDFPFGFTAGGGAGSPDGGAGTNWDRDGGRGCGGGGGGRRLNGASGGGGGGYSGGGGGGGNFGGGGGGSFIASFATGTSAFVSTAGGNGFATYQCDLCPGFDDNGPDADTDGVPDACDVCPGFDDNGPDADTDGVPNACDLCSGFDDNVDADTDGIPDGCDVCPNSPNVRNVTQGTFHATIQQGVDAALAGDVIELGACTLAERGITLNNKDITIRGQGPDVTIIDGENVSGTIIGFIAGDESTVENLTIRNGIADSSNGGVVQLFGGTTAALFRNCRFENNDAGATRTGAVYVDAAQAAFEQCVFAGNTTARNVSALWINGATSSGRLINCLFYKNSGSTTAAVFCQFGMLDMANCTFANGLDATTLRENAGGNITATNCVFDPGSSTFLGNINLDRSLFTGGTGTNIDGQPTFVDGANDDYRFAAGSLGIDAADFNAYSGLGGGPWDLNGDLRLYDDPDVVDTGLGLVTYADMGAYEYQGVIIPGDCDANGAVDLVDYADFAPCLLGPGGGLGAGCECSDLDADGDSDLHDFAEFQLNFTTVP